MPFDSLSTGQDRQEHPGYLSVYFEPRVHDLETRFRDLETQVAKQTQVLAKIAEISESLTNVVGTLQDDLNRTTEVLIEVQTATRLSNNA